MTQGCYVIITQDMLIAASAFLLVGEGDMSASHVFRGLHAGSYSVVVYSVKNSMMFEVNGRPVFTREVNVTGPSSVSSALQHTVAAGEWALHSTYITYVYSYCIDSIVQMLAPTVSSIRRRSEKNVGIIHSVLGEW